MLLVGDLIGPHRRCLRVKGTFVVGFAEETLNAEENRAHVVQGRPLFFENVETQSAIKIDVLEETQARVRKMRS